MDRTARMGHCWGMESLTAQTPPDCAETNAGAAKKKQAPWMGKRGEQPSTIPWRDIQSAIESGVSMSKTAKRFAEFHPKGADALLECIKKRAQRRKWIVPASLMGKAQLRLEEAGYDVPELSQPCKTPVSDREKVGTLVSESVAEMGERGNLIGLRLLSSQLERAAKNPQRLAPIVDTQDVVSALKGVRLAAGMDKQGPQIALNLWSGSPNVPTHVPGDIRDIIEGQDE